MTLLELGLHDQFVHVGVDDFDQEPEDSLTSEWDEEADLEEEDDNPIAEVLFNKLRKRGFCIEELVFAPTGLVHPEQFYTPHRLKINPALGQEVTLEDAIREIKRILETGEYTPIDSGITINDYLEEFPGSKPEDFIIGGKVGDAVN